MGFWNLLAIGAVGGLIHKARKNARKEREIEKRRVHEIEMELERERLRKIEQDRKEMMRKNTPCHFTDGISEEEFKQIVIRVVKRIRRVDGIYVEGAVVSGVVESLSGISEWGFTVDFNDYGHITGNYWVNSDNSQSNIPYIVASKIRDGIMPFLHLDEPIDDTIPNEDLDFEEYSYGEYDEMEEPKNNFGYTDESIHIEKSIRDSEIQMTKRKKIVKASVIIIVVLVLLCLGLIGFSELKKLTAVGYNSDELIGLHYEEVIDKLERGGFTEVYPDEMSDLDIQDVEQEHIVIEVRIGEDTSFNAKDKYAYDDIIYVVYHTLRDVEAPISSEEVKGQNYIDIEKKFKKAGFVNIKYKVEYDVVAGWLVSAGEVKSVVIDGEDEFSEGYGYRPDCEVVITYHELRKKKPE